MSSVTAQVEGIEWIVLLILVAFGLVIVEELLRRRRKQEQQSERASPPTQPHYPMPPPQVHQIVQHTIERQVVKVRCRHCGALNVETDGRCVACSAPL